MELPESDSLINVHHFQDSVDLVTVHYHIIQMKDCYFLWIGTSDCSFNSMAMAITTKYVSYIIVGGILSLVLHVRV